MTKTLSTMDQLVGEIGAGRTAIFYRQDGTTKTVTFRDWDELFKQAKAWDAERIHVTDGGRFVNFRGDWYWFEDR